MYSVMPDSRS